MAPPKTGPGPEPLDFEYGYERKPDGTIKKKWKLATADIALIIGGIVFLVLLLCSIFIESWREAIFTGALPALFGLLTVAVGGVAAYKLFKGK